MGNIIKKADNKRFVDEVQKMLHNMGATKRREGILDTRFFALKTKYGQLDIILDLDNTFLFTVFCKFKNLMKIKKFDVPCNQNSGKYNFHFTGDIDDALINFENHLFDLLEEKQQLKYQVLKYDLEQIRKSLESLYFNTDFEYFENELKSYEVEDLRPLLNHLKNNN